MPLLGLQYYYKITQAYYWPTEFYNIYNMTIQQQQKDPLHGNKN